MSTLEKTPALIDPLNVRVTFQQLPKGSVTTFPLSFYLDSSSIAGDVFPGISAAVVTQMEEDWAGDSGWHGADRTGIPSSAISGHPVCLQVSEVQI